MTTELDQSVNKSIKKIMQLQWELSRTKQHTYEVGELCYFEGIEINRDSLQKEFHIVKQEKSTVVWILLLWKLHTET